MLIAWVRHGENVANLTATFSHRVVDADLTDLGRGQAHDVGRRLAADGAQFTVVACSPLRRARQTADIVADHLGRPVDLVLEELRELDVGSLDGRRDVRSWAIYEDVLSAWRRGDRARRFPGGEDCHELVARIRSGLTTVARAACGGSALVVGHGGNARAALPDLTGGSDPGRDLATGDVAWLEVTAPSLGAGPAFRLRRWRDPC